MTYISIDGFGGKIPRFNNQKLPIEAATKAQNLRAFGRSLDSWRREKLVHSPSMTGIKSIYRMHSGATDYWLTWQSYVDVVKDPGADGFPIFYTGDQHPKKTDLSLGTTAPPYPADYLEMGIPKPQAPTASVNVSGSGASSTRNYIVTFVNQWNEEGPPSDASNDVTFGATGFTIDLSGLDLGNKSVVSINRSGTTATVNCVGHGFYDKSLVTIAGANEGAYNGEFEITVVDEDNFTYEVAGSPSSPATGTITAAGNYGLTKLRIYRSLTGSTGVTNYQLVKEHTLGTATTTDTVEDSSLGEICPSFETTSNGTVIVGSEWNQPLETMKNIILHPGNFAVGIAGKLLCMSEPNQLHAWPVRYQIKLDFDAVGIGVVGNSIVVATKGRAYVITGTHPSFMSKDSDEGSEPCTSDRGVVSLPAGVIYPTPHGLQIVRPGGSSNVLDPWVKRREWQEQYFPDTIVAVVWQNAYFAFYNNGTTTQGFIFDPGNNGGELVDLSFEPEGLYVDPESKTIYYVDADDIFEFDADTLNLQPFDWASKEFVLPREVNLAWAQIDGDFEQLGGDVASENAARDAEQAANAVILAADPFSGVAARADNTAYSLGDTVKLSEQHLVCTTAGTSAGSAPSLAGLVLGNTVADGTVTWTLRHQVQSQARGCLNESLAGEFTLNGSLLFEPFMYVYDKRSITFQLYAWDYDSSQFVIKHAESVMNPRAFPLPSGYRSHIYYAKLSGNVELTGLKMAESIKELKAL